jgi:broad specificity phosphatase PhoE
LGRYGFLSVCPHLDNFLTPGEGRRKVVERALDLKNRKIKIDAIFSSPNTRAYQTAWIINRVAEPQVDIVQKSALQEEKMGQMERQPYEVFNANLIPPPPVGNRFEDGVQGGETGNELMDRTCDLLDESRKDSSNTTKRTKILVTSFFNVAALFRISLSTAEMLEKQSKEGRVAWLAAHKPANADWVSFRLPIKS